MLILYSLTPILGALRNYVKYKKFNIKLFIRTPVTYYFIHILLINFNKLNYVFKNNNIILYTLIYERWFFLIYKTILSYINNDYYFKREKYIKKYGLQY